MAAGLAWSAGGAGDESLPVPLIEHKHGHAARDYRPQRFRNVLQRIGHIVSRNSDAVAVLCYLERFK
jgi:hypothetical protein